MSNPSAIKICIVSLYSYPLFNRDIVSPFGGSEVRISLIAKGLANKCHFDVSLIVFDHGQPPIERRHGVTIYSWRGRHCPLLVEPPSLRVSSVAAPGWARIKSRTPLIIWRIGRLLFHFIQRIFNAIFGLAYGLARYLKLSWRRILAKGAIGPHIVDSGKIAIYNEVDADIYMMPGNHEMAAELALFCKKFGKKYVMLAGSDMDFDSGIIANPHRVNNYGVPGYLMHYAINNADALIVQHEGQALLLQKNFKRSAKVFRNPIDLVIDCPRSIEPRSILWVGKSDSVKRPELVLDLAELLPEYKFEMILSFSSLAIHNRCVERVDQLSNVTIYNYIPYHKVEQYFATAKVLLNTSRFEGFPNAFLQAAKFGVPIVSFQLDPGEMLSKYNSGFVCDGDLNLVKHRIVSLATHPVLYKEKSDSCLKYVTQFHSKDLIIDQYGDAIKSIADLGLRK
jgi:glycosyltransferase involved in cell wall biosynthesis